ncbi:MAG: addiction module protein [Bacteroidota bacterium]
MSNNFENVLEQVQMLNRFEQLQLISTIAQGLTNEEPKELPRYVIQENRRRLADYDAGVTQAIPYKKAMRSIRDQIKNRV